MNLTDKLTLLMQNKGINKRQLSQLSKIPYTTIDGLYKKGYANAKLSTLQQLASFFDVSLDYICNDNITDVEFGKKQKINVDDNSLQKLTTDEQELLNDYRSLSVQGKESIRQQMFMHLKIYHVEASDVSDMEIG